jgi:hypothetical protein
MQVLDDQNPLGKFRPAGSTRREVHRYTSTFNFVQGVGGIPW